MIVAIVSVGVLLIAVAAAIGYVYGYAHGGDREHEAMVTARDATAGETPIAAAVEAEIDPRAIRWHRTVDRAPTSDSPQFGPDWP